MSKRLILLLIAGTAMAQNGTVQQAALWQRAKPGAASRPPAAAKPADPKGASAQPTPPGPEVAAAVRWERAKDRAAQRQMAKTKKK
jgi:hypothetical protein